MKPKHLPTFERFCEMVEHALTYRLSDRCIDAKSAKHLVTCLARTVELHRKLGDSAVQAADAIQATAATFLPLQAGGLRAAINELVALEAFLAEHKDALARILGQQPFQNRMLVLHATVHSLTPLLLGDKLPCAPSSSGSPSASSDSSATRKSNATDGSGGAQPSSSDGPSTVAVNEPACVG